jgi:hypothetical protein
MQTTTSKPTKQASFEAFKNDLFIDWTKAEKNTDELNDDWLKEVSENDLVLNGHFEAEDDYHIEFTYDMAA